MSAEGVLRIAIADDHEIVRSGLRAVIEGRKGWEVVGAAMDGREAVEVARTQQPDVFVVDVGMPELNGFEATRGILGVSPRTQVLILTHHESEEVVRESLRAGARGCVLKSDGVGAILAAIETLGTQSVYFTPRVSELVLAGYTRRPDEGPEQAGPSRKLTRREREIVQLLSEGYNGKQIALNLKIGVKTIETHRAHIMKKLGVHSVAELVRYAIRNKMVEA